MAREILTSLLVLMVLLTGGKAGLGSSGDAQEEMKDAQHGTRTVISPHSAPRESESGEKCRLGDGSTAARRHSAGDTPRENAQSCGRGVGRTLVPGRAQGDVCDPRAFIRSHLIYYLNLAADHHFTPEKMKCQHDYTKTLI